MKRSLTKTTTVTTSARVVITLQDILGLIPELENERPGIAVFTYVEDNGRDTTLLFEDPKGYIEVAWQWCEVATEELPEDRTYEGLAEEEQ